MDFYDYFLAEESTPTSIDKFRDLDVDELIKHGELNINNLLQQELEPGPVALSTDLRSAATVEDLSQLCFLNDLASLSTCLISDSLALTETWLQPSLQLRPGLHDEFTINPLRTSLSTILIPSVEPYRPTPSSTMWPQTHSKQTFGPSSLSSGAAGGLATSDDIMTVLDGWRSGANIIHTDTSPPDWSKTAMLSQGDIGSQLSPQHASASLHQGLDRSGLHPQVEATPAFATTRSLDTTGFTDIPDDGSPLQAHESAGDNMTAIVSREILPRSGDREQQQAEPASHTNPQLSPKTSESSKTNRRTVNHPSEADWEHLKETIHDLYRLQNLTVVSLEARMRSQHDFHATANMYKKRFKKWKWLKYIPRHGRSPDKMRTRNNILKSCQRKPPNPRQGALNLTSTPDAKIMVALRQVKILWDDDFAQSPRWSNTGISDMINSARGGLHILHEGLRLLYENKRRVGRKFIKKGLQLLSVDFHERSLDTTHHLLRWAVMMMICWAQPQMIRPFLNWVTQICRDKFTKRTTGNIALTMLGLWCASPEHMTRFIDSWYTLESDFLTRNEVVTSSATLWRKQNQLRAQLHLGICTALEWEVTQLLDKYNQLIDRAVIEGENEHAWALIDEQLVVQSDFEIYAEDYVERCQQCMDLLTACGEPCTRYMIWQAIYYLETEDTAAAASAVSTLSELVDQGARVSRTYLYRLIAKYEIMEMGDAVEKLQDMVIKDQERQDIINLAVQFEGVEIFEEVEAVEALEELGPSDGEHQVTLNAEISRSKTADVEEDTIRLGEETS